MRIEKSNYNEKTGISTVTIKTGIGNFTGTSKLWECDKDAASSYFGCFCAEIKARKKYTKELRKQKQNRLNILRSTYKALQCGEFNANSPEMRRFRKIIKGLEKEINNLKHMDVVLTNSILDGIDERDETIKKINK